MVTTISSNRPRSERGRQCKYESNENNGNGQSQRGNSWPWVHRLDVQCGVERSSSKLWKTADGCERSAVANMFLSTDETL